MNLMNAGTATARYRFRGGSGRIFYRTLRHRVDEHFRSTGCSRYADRTVFAKALLFATCAAGTYGLILFGGFGRAGMLALAVAYGLSTLLLAVNLAHDAAHNAVVPDRRVNMLLLVLCFTLVGADPYLWRLRHVKSHHNFPNVNGCDIDIDSNVFLRLSPNHPRRWFQRYQHLYAPLIFWLVDIHTVFVQDVHYLFKRRLANLVDIRHPAWAYVLFLACKAAYVCIVFVIPALVLPVAWWEVLVGALIMSFVASVAFVYMLIGTHFCEEAEFPEVAEDGTIEHDWAVHALITSVDWNPGSRLAHFIAGGANAHAAHHLFPAISHAHYREITPIIERTAAEFGIPYHATTLPRMIASHFRFLRRLARLPRIAAT